MQDAHIALKAQEAGLDPGLLYEAVIDLAAENNLTASTINKAATILLNDLSLPRYFFNIIDQNALSKLLKAIALSMQEGKDGECMLQGQVRPVDFNLGEAGHLQVLISTREARTITEHKVESEISGHRRSYYFNPDNGYATCLLRPETVADFSKDDFKKSRFLFSLAGDYIATPEPTRLRYEEFLKKDSGLAEQLIELYNLPETGETRIMFNSDFERPQLPVLRKLFEEYGCAVTRACWEPYLAKEAVPSSICSFYVKGELSRTRETEVKTALRAFLSFAVKGTDRLYLEDQLTFEEMLFAGNAVDFCRLFIYQEHHNRFNLELMDALDNNDRREILAKRLSGSNRAIFTQVLLEETVRKNPDLIKMLYALFAGKFDPKNRRPLSEEDILERQKEFDQLIAVRFMDSAPSYTIFSFMFKLITSTRKTNFFKDGKRSFAFRCNNDVLDPLVYRQHVHGVFFVNGHYACGTHLRAAEIARGGLRMLRVNPANHQTLLDGAVLLNYALGTVAQRLKHKDICESGAKGVVVPHPQYARHTLEALTDYTEGILDLVLPDPQVVDCLGTPELIFFGPDEGTAPMMDTVARHARARGYSHWRTLTTGKSIGIPHDTFGFLDSGEVFGLFEMEGQGMELQIEGKRELLTTDMGAIYDRIGEHIRISGMTTTSVMGSFYTLIEHAGEKEEDLNLMMTGGPGGDLGANEIQCYTGKICMILDGGSVLFDPEGLDKRILREIAFQRNVSPRPNSTYYPLDKLSKNGFRVLNGSKNTILPDGRVIADGTLFHRTFLTDPANRALIEQANIRAFIPCGGLKDTINNENVAQFASLFKELRFIVEGANVFFDDAARRYLALNTPILQVKDFTANKGGVFCSSVAEVLPSFLLQDRYEEVLIEDNPTRWALVRDIIDMVAKYARMETELLIKWHEQDKSTPLFELGKLASESIFSFQDSLLGRLPEILADDSLIDQVLQSYIPAVLLKKLGLGFIKSTLGTPVLAAYRDAIITKKIASMAFYRYGLEWDDFLQEAEEELIPALHKAVQ
ncbi:MAG: NADP-specific glutamate dehydrogenase GdhA [Desulfobulbaceae bacterium]|nr:NADP-specific glutamate dehydrogenase GdhA [Desulfobulbaceae bacterium]